MDYGYQRIIKKSFDEVEADIRNALQDQGFGVLTEIVVDETFKKKLNVNFRRYKILGACHPTTAFKALSTELEIGLLLPCNVTLWENDDGTVTLSAIDAVKMLSVSGRDDLDELAGQVTDWLKAAVDAV